ncbi:hypothetical protein, partial [Priestia megaterium]|uniref:hypothetical protein n=1 Tax=Priestia megaterium TaxID=1404 RepID=UPI00300B0910
LRGLIYSTISAGVFVLLSNQQLEAHTYMIVITIKNPNVLDSPSRISIHRSDLSSTKILLS